MVNFGGWWLPVQFTSIIEEHHAVRKLAGMFDISHMGEFFVNGPDALRFLNAALTNDVDALLPGQCQYSLLLNDQAGVIDDLMVYRIQAESFLLVVNAAKIAEDWRRLHALAAFVPNWEFTLENRSEQSAALAIQGPMSPDIVSLFLGSHIVQLPSRHQIKAFDWQGLTLLVARTGYTGEDGFELFFASDAAARVWAAVLDQGAVLGLKPCGLGARDTLRLEACLPLNGQDLSPEHTPIEAGLGKFVSTRKAADFPGKAACLEQKKSGVSRKLIAFKLIEKGAPPRPHYPLCAQAIEIGQVTSGTHSPTLDCGIGMGYIAADYAVLDRSIEVNIRGNLHEAVIVSKPIYKRTAA
jgi:aminomethyltransferase